MQPDGSHETAENEFLRGILSCIRDFVFVLDYDGKFHYANKALLELWGVTEAQALGKTMADLQYPPEVERTVLADTRKVIATGMSLRNVTPYTSPSGHWGYYEYDLALIDNVDGVRGLVAGSARDVTERELALQDKQVALLSQARAVKS